MKPIKLFTVAVMALVLLAQGALAESQQQPSAEQQKPENPISWREQYAYSLGMATYPYAYPYLYMSQLRWMWTTLDRDLSNTPYIPVPVNHFSHGDKLTTAEYRDGGSPNNDTLYSITWLNLSEQPIILSHPEMGERYFTFEIAGYDVDNFAYVGQRTTGSAAGDFAIYYDKDGKGFDGELPDGVKVLPPSPSPWVLILGRTLVDGTEDLPNVAALQKQYRLTPLSYWDKVKNNPNVKLPASRDVWAPYSPKKDSLASWRTINRAMTENPPAAKEKAILDLLAELHIGPGKNLDNLDEDAKKGLARAAKDGHRMLVKARNNIISDEQTTFNGWDAGPSHKGRSGQVGKYLYRGIINSKGIISNDHEEAKYYSGFKDSQGNFLDASKADYELTFAKGEEPPVESFWSVTLYDETSNLVDNPLDRYSLGDRSKDLKRNKDGSLTFYFQSMSPGKDKESNWLPTPDGRFIAITRVYRPKAAALDNSWVMPALKVKKH